MIGRGDHRVKRKPDRAHLTADRVPHCITTIFPAVATHQVAVALASLPAGDTHLGAQGHHVEELLMLLLPPSRHFGGVTPVNHLKPIAWMESTLSVFPS